MIRRADGCQVAFAAGTRRADGARRRTALGNPRSTGEPLTIQGCFEKANRPRNGAHHRRLGKICRGLGPALLRELGGHRGDAAGQELARRLLRARDLEVEVVVASM
jgi:hypothetical protein